MKKLTTLFTLLLFISCTRVMAWTGSGTAGSPYQITTAAELATLATNVNGGNTYAGTYFKLINDLSLSAYSNWNPIGKSEAIYFSGVFDGNNKIITNLTINSPISGYLGLFGYVSSGCEIKDLSIEGCNVYAYENVGSLIGKALLNTANKSIRITNCKSSGTVEGTYGIGGLIGSVVYISGTGGDSYPLLISNCSSSATVSGDEEDVGGLIGYIYGNDFSIMPLVSNCYATGNVTSAGVGATVGGLIGWANKSQIVNCFARGNVVANGTNAQAGGFVGFTTNATFTNCYSTGAVSGTAESALGFIGSCSFSTINSCYWDMGTSGKTTSGGPEVGKTTAEMKTQGTFTDWDFSTPVWRISAASNDGYPVHVGIPGTSDNPFLITTATELATLATNVNGGNTYSGTYFKLMNDISLSGYPDWNPIGNNGKPFKGLFDGNSKKITGLTITSNNFNYRALFGLVEAGCEIKNLTIEGCNVAGWAYVGALIGVASISEANKSIKISNCKSSGTVVGGYYAGGLIGVVNYTSGSSGATFPLLISYCSSSATVSCGGSTAGGLIGLTMGTNSVDLFPIVSNSYATGSVTATGSSARAGGLIGSVTYAIIINCFASGTVSATDASAEAGGCVGSLTSATVTNCYSAGVITGTSSLVLGFIGSSFSGTITSCFWDKETSGRTTSGGSEVGKSTEQMKTQGTYTDWDFSTPVWKISSGSNNGYPELFNLADVPATTPTTQAGLITFTNVTAYTATINWTKGNGTKRAVFVRQDNTGTASPVDNTTYIANTSFGNSGSQIASSGWYCVYNGTSNIVEITGLSPSTNYIAQVFEYNGGAGSEKYLTTTVTDNPKVQQTIALIAPVTQASSLVFSAVTISSITASWTIGNGTKRAVFVKQDNTGTASPIDNTTYTANPSFGNSGSQIASSGWYCVYNGTSNTVTVSNLSPGTNYIFQVFEYNGVPGSEKYQTGTVTDNPKVQQTLALSAPSAPTDLSATAGNLNATITFTAGYNGGSAITNYQYSTDNGVSFTPCSPAVTTSPVVITGLTNGVTYQILLKAVNAIGAGTASSAVSATPNNLVGCGDLSFNGTSSYINISPIPSYSNTFTIEAWIKSTSTGAEKEIVGWGNTSGSVSNNVQFRMESGKLQFGQDVTTWNSATSSASINTGNWVHVAVVRTNTTVKLYVNGTQDYSSTFSSNLANVNVLNIGTYTKMGSVQSNYFPGTIKDVRIWNTARSATEISTYKNVLLTGSETGLVAYYKLNEGVGTNANNSVSGSYTGTINSGTWNLSSSLEIASQSTAAQTQPVGGTFSPISVTLSSAFPLASYQWYSNASASNSDGTSLGSANGAQTASYTPQAVSGGTLYYYCVVSNGSCSSATSSVSEAFTVSVFAPAAPTSLSATPGNGSATISFTAGSNGGSAITNYQYSIDNGSTFIPFSPAVTTSPVTITGLTNGTTYQVMLKAVNDIGVGSASSAVSVSPFPVGCGDLSFNGSSTYVSFASYPPYSSTFTIEAWIKSTSSAAEREIVGWGNSSGSVSNNVQFRLESGKIQFGQDVTSWSSVTGSTNVNSGNWVHVAVVKNGTAVSLYVNGNLDASGSVLNQSANINTMNIGDYYKQGVLQNNYFPGTIKDVRIWNTARSATDISTNKNVYLTGSESGLVAYYKLNEGGGATAYNTVSSSYTGTINNGTWNTSATLSMTSQSTSGQTQNIGGTFSPITVTMSSAFPLASYQWYSNTSSSNSDGTSLGSANGAQTASYTPQASVGGTLYYYCVVSNGTCSSATSEVSGSFIVRSAPLAPSSLVATPGNGSATIGFTAGSDGGSPITNYQYSTDGSIWTALSPAITTSPVAITGLNNGTTYTIYLRAINAIGNGTSSASVSVTPALTCVNPTSAGAIAADQRGETPFDPVAFTSTSAATGQTGTLEYKWQSSITSSSTGFSDISPSNSATHDAGALSVTTWFKRLARVDCKSDWTGAVESNVLKVTVIATEPTLQPTGLYFSNTISGPNTNIVLNYTASASATSYLVVRKTGSSPTFVPVDGTAYTSGAQGSDQVVYVGTALTCTDASITKDLSYYYKVYAFNGSSETCNYLDSNPLNGNSICYTASPATLGNDTGNPVSAGFSNQGVNITFPNGTTGTTLSVSKTASTPASNLMAMPAGVRGVKSLYYTITSSNASHGNFTLLLDFSALGLTNTQWNNYKVLKRTDPSSAWVDVTTLSGVSITNRQTDGIWGKFTITGLSSFSEFAIGDTDPAATIVNNITQPLSGITLIEDGTKIGQAFTNDNNNRTLTSIDISITEGGANAVIMLHSSLDGSIGYEIGSFSGTPVSGNFWKFTPNFQVALKANTTYFIVMHSTVPGTTSYEYTNSTEYTGVGRIPALDCIKMSTDGGNSWTSNNIDFGPYMLTVSGDIITSATWTGSTSSVWNNDGNWAPAIVPTATVSVNIPNVANDPVIGAASATAEVCNDLTIETGAVLTISADKALTVNGNLVNSADTTGLVIKSNINGTGSLKVLGTVSAAASVQRFANLNRWYLVSSPIGTQTLKDFIDKNTDIPVLSNDANAYGIRDYATGALSNWNDYFTNSYLTGNSAREMGVGKGYLVRTFSDGTPKTLNFQGNLNSQGDLDVTLAKSGVNGWNLIGNPYASAIKIHDGTSEIEATPDNFINANDAKFDDIAYGVYFWNDASTPKKFDVINNIYKPITYAQVGQGFFVKAKFSGSSTMSFTAAMQFHMGTEALKSTNTTYPKLGLVASMGDQSASTDILFVEGATKGLDRGYDAGILKADPSFAIYTKLVEPFDGEFQLQCLPPTDYSKLVIPIGIDSKAAGEIVLSVETVQLDPTCKVILEDKLTHTFTDLSKNSYKTAVAANTAGTGRFYLHTGDIISGLQDQVLSEKITAYAIGNKEIRVLGEVGDGAVATLVNGLGQVVLTKRLSAGSLNIIGLPNLTSGVYLLNINDKGTPQTIKIMIRK